MDFGGFSEFVFVFLFSEKLNMWSSFSLFFCLRMQTNLKRSQSQINILREQPVANEYPIFKDEFMLRCLFPLLPSYLSTLYIVDVNRCATYVKDISSYNLKVPYFTKFAKVFSQ